MSQRTQEPVFTTVADGVRAQVVQRQLLPPHLSAGAHEGRSSSCRCRPLLPQLHTTQQWVVVPRGTREACTQEEHDLRPLRTATWRDAPPALLLTARDQRVDLLLTMCAYCGAVEVRDVSYHQPLGMRRAATLAPRRRSDVLGWYAGARPGGRVYV